MSSTNSSSQGKLDHIRELFETGRADQALQFIEKTGSQTSELKNAFGVCLMRVGQTDRAVTTLRELVFQRYMCIPADTPPLFQANYATALLLKNYNQPAIDIIEDLPTSAHPYIGRLRQTIHQWRKTLPIYHRAGCLIKLYPPTPVIMSYPPGDL
ncbi:MAG: hypothetical protein IH624_18735 [Phycisphaerae bacterium]|nr:hypothetical protein [Phycisphaerae bacterium]